MIWVFINVRLLSFLMLLMSFSEGLMHSLGIGELIVLISEILLLEFRDFTDFFEFRTTLLESLALLLLLMILVCIFRIKFLCKDLYLKILFLTLWICEIKTLLSALSFKSRSFSLSSLLSFLLHDANNVSLFKSASVWPSRVPIFWVFHVSWWIFSTSLYGLRCTLVRTYFSWCKVFLSIISIFLSFLSAWMVLEDLKWKFADLLLLFVWFAFTLSANVVFIVFKNYVNWINYIVQYFI